MKVSHVLPGPFFFLIGVNDRFSVARGYSSISSDSFSMQKETGNRSNGLGRSHLSARRLSLPALFREPLLFPKPPHGHQVGPEYPEGKGDVSAQVSDGHGRQEANAHVAPDRSLVSAAGATARWLRRRGGMRVIKHWTARSPESNCQSKFLPYRCRASKADRRSSSRHCSAAFSLAPR